MNALWYSDETEFSVPPDFEKRIETILVANNPGAPAPVVAQVVPVAPVVVTP